MKLRKAKAQKNKEITDNKFLEQRSIMEFIVQELDLEGNLIATGNANLLKTKFTPDYVKALDNNEGFEDVVPE